MMRLSTIGALGACIFSVISAAGATESEAQSSRGFFSRFSSQLLAEIETDANAGNVDAMYLHLLHRLWQTDQSTDETRSLRIRAAAAGHPFAQHDLCILEAIVAEGEPSTENCFRAAFAGHVRAQSFLGLGLSLGFFGLKEDPALALSFYRKAAFQGDGAALAAVGDSYYGGMGIEKDDALAVLYWQRAASVDSAVALRELGRAYALGRGVSEDYDLSLRSLNRAADLGDGPAQYYAGLMYRMNANNQSAYVMVSLAIKELPPGEMRDSAMKVRGELDRVLSRSEVKRAKSIAAKWKKQEPNPTPFIAGTEFTKRLQAALNRRGYEAGEEDGLAGGKTLSAYRKFAETLQTGELKYQEPDIFYVAYRLNLFGTTAPPVTRQEQNVASATVSSAAGGVELAERVISGGSGFAINDDGVVVTNAHVVKGCLAVRVVDGRSSRKPATVLEMSEFSDLAILKASDLASRHIGFRASTAPKLGESIVVFGFPLTSVLSDQGNLTVGNITALAGMNGDPSLFQISAPVQPGNSGGPVLDSKGQLIGIVVGKLNAIAVAGVTDDIPQNVNFAIKSSVLENLLQSRSIDYGQGDAAAPDLPVTELAAQAKDASVLVECLGS